MYFLVKCVIHTQHYRGDDAIFIFLENTKKKKQSEQRETGCLQFKVTNYDLSQTKLVFVFVLGSKATGAART